MTKNKRKELSNRNPEAAVGHVQALQEAYIRKVVDAVQDLPNVLYEVANESSGRGTVESDGAPRRSNASAVSNRKITGSVQRIYKNRSEKPCHFKRT